MSIINYNVRVDWVKWLEEQKRTKRGKYADLLDEYEAFCKDLGSHFHLYSVDITASDDSLHLSMVTKDGLYHMIIPQALAKAPKCKRKIEWLVARLCARRL